MDMKERIGKYISSTTPGEEYSIYVPPPLPPKPSLKLEPIYPLLDKANIAIGRLDGIGNVLPNQDLFLYMYIRKEAVLSSQIEGTQSSLSDLIMFENEEAPGVPEHDVIEVSNYVAAMEHGLNRLSEGFPLCLRLIKEIHEILLSRGRGSFKQPGEFRRSQNWIGGTRPGNAKFAPPSPEYLMQLLGDLESFLHNEHHLPCLIKAALIHVQFETIHPFLDGNGRLGRLLITFLLCAEGLLSKPLLYLSLYFKTYRQEYYDYLQVVREKGDWEAWIIFFLEGVIETANQATKTAKKIIGLFDEDHKKIKTLGRASTSAFMVHHYFGKHSITDIGKIAKNCNLTIPTVTKAINALENLNIIKEITGKERLKVYSYDKYINILSEGIGIY
ncbi:Fic family protein [Thiotrichales bacterium 19S9-12]|nr:Fic family protein [Thiotrichales bacterium 19S9-11]MCF6811540.1 Fic family protein [Thiotrichales bacterium 19S9-12]